jgi:hypothetical protein
MLSCGQTVSVVVCKCSPCVGAFDVCSFGGIRSCLITKLHREKIVEQQLSWGNAFNVSLSRQRTKKTLPSYIRTPPNEFFPDERREDASLGLERRVRY